MNPIVNTAPVSQQIYCSSKASSSPQWIRRVVRWSLDEKRSTVTKIILTATLVFLSISLIGIPVVYMSCREIHLQKTTQKPHVLYSPYLPPKPIHEEEKPFSYMSFASLKKSSIEEILILKNKIKSKLPDVHPIKNFPSATTQFKEDLYQNLNQIVNVVLSEVPIYSINISCQKDLITWKSNSEKTLLNMEENVAYLTKPCDVYFPCKGLENYDGSSCFIITTLQAIAHSKKFDYSLMQELRIRTREHNIDFQNRQDLQALLRITIAKLRDPNQNNIVTSEELKKIRLLTFGNEEAEPGDGVAFFKYIRECLDNNNIIPECNNDNPSAYGIFTGGHFYVYVKVEDDAWRKIDDKVVSKNTITTQSLTKMHPWKSISI